MLYLDTYYHIFNHANGEDNLFREEKNYFFFKEKYRKHIDPVAETLAWCLMPNHFHLLVKIKSEEDIAADSTVSNFSKVSNFGKVVNETAESAGSKFISKQFANFFSSYTQSFNKVYNRRGSLFIKNFKRKEVSDEEYLRNLILYIHLNPVKHGFTTSVNDWRHSSYSIFPERQTQWLEVLFGDESNYHSMHRAKEMQFAEYEILESELT
ncbi:MAG: transposase [Flavobacteriales bacterium]|nr:transposase [Flavobacteriales bacterium]